MLSFAVIVVASPMSVVAKVSLKPKTLLSSTAPRTRSSPREPRSGG